MFSALKAFGKGLLWAVLIPFILAGMAIVAVFGVFDFFVEFVIMIINFFRGKKLFPVYPEDEKAYEILQRAIDKQNGELPAQQAGPMPTQPVYVQQNYYVPGQPGQVPPYYQPGQMPPYQQPGQMPPYQQPGQIPPYQQQPGQMPPYQQPGEIPQYVQQSGQVPPYYQPGQMPPVQPQPTYPPNPNDIKPDNSPAPSPFDDDDDEGGED